MPLSRGFNLSGRNFSLKEMETNPEESILAFQLIFVRKELLSERDGNYMATLLGSWILSNSSGRNFSLKEMETRSEGTDKPIISITVRKELLSERDGNLQTYLYLQPSIRRVRKELLSERDGNRLTPS